MNVMEFSLQDGLNVGQLENDTYQTTTNAEYNCDHVNR